MPPFEGRIKNPPLHNSKMIGRILINEPLARHTTFRIGGVAGRWVEPDDTDALKDLLKKAKAANIDYLIIGEGSKLLIQKKRIPLALHLGARNFKRLAAEDRDLVAGAGVNLRELLLAASQHNLGGLEFLSGIPATVGGSLVNNAGVSWPRGLEIKDFLKTVEVMDGEGDVLTLKKKDLEFGYRFSCLKKYIVLEARFSLFKRKKDKIISEAKRFWDYRKSTQELRYPSSGCIFKNPEGESSGALIDLCGLKGRRIGDAAISPKHANFIINLGEATARDVLNLMRLAQREVYKRFGIKLEPEIEVV